MKNYLFKSLFKIADPDWKVVNRSREVGMFDNYVSMNDLSWASAKKFLAGSWEYVYLTGEFDTINQAFEHTFWKIKELWDREPCNILYTDPDTLFVNTVNIWNQFDTFMMFNYTDPPQLTSPNVYNKKFDHFFNAGVRYFPSTMNSQVWEIGCDMAKNWDHTTYDTEQIILNTMLWSQGIDVDRALHPAIAYQAFGPNPHHWTAWNKIDIGQAGILHFHGSRGSKNRLEIMQKIAEQIKL